MASAKQWGAHLVDVVDVGDTESAAREHGAINVVGSRVSRVVGACVEAEPRVSSARRAKRIHETTYQGCRGKRPAGIQARWLRIRTWSRRSGRQSRRPTCRRRGGSRRRRWREEGCGSRGHGTTSRSGFPNQDQGVRLGLRLQKRQRVSFTLAYGPPTPQCNSATKGLTIGDERAIWVDTVHAGCPNAHVSECRRSQGEKKEGGRKARHDQQCRLKGVLKR